MGERKAVYILLFVMYGILQTEAISDGVCVRKLVNGKLVSVGACEENDGKTVAGEIRKRLKDSEQKESTTQAAGKAETEKNCEVEYRSKCFTYVAKTSRIDEGRSLCTNIGGQLANIYDTTHYKLIDEYLQTKITHSILYAWTGLTYQNRKFYLTTGGEVVFSEEYLYAGLPDISTRSTTHLYVSKDLSSTLRGIAIPPQESQAYGSLCEI